MRAELRDQRRREAIEREQAQRSTPEERAALWRGVQRMMAGLKGRVPAKRRREQALEIYRAQLVQLEQDKEKAAHKVQLLGPMDRLVIPRASVLVTLDEEKRLRQTSR